MPDTALPVVAKAKQPPGRRRPGPNTAKSANRNKNYASENDAAAVDPNFRPDFARNGQKPGGGAPHTPRKKPQKINASAAQAKSPAAPGQQSVPGKSSRRSKNGPKNAVNPNVANKQHNGHRTPPGKGTAPISASPDADGGQGSLMSTSAPSSALATQVFAGNSFHASPAPSALPRPSFMQKSSAAIFASPESPRAQPTSGLSLVQQPSPPASDSELPSSTATKGDHPFTNDRNSFLQHGAGTFPEASPLEFIFQADRAEKAKNRRASAANIHSVVPQQQFTSPRVDDAPATSSSYTFPRDVSHQQHQVSVRRPAPNLRGLSSGISAAELDGNPGQPIGPAFATPFQERMRAAKTADNREALNGSTSGPGGPFGDFPGFRNAEAGRQAMPPTGPQGSHMLTPPMAMQSPGGQRKTAGSELEDSLKRLLFSSPTASPSAAPPAMSSPTRQQAPPTLPGYPGAFPFPGMYPRTDGILSQSSMPSHNAHGPPPAQGRPFGHIDPRFQDISYNGAAQGGDPGNRNFANKAAMENSIRQILKLGSSNN